MCEYGMNEGYMYMSETTISQNIAPAGTHKFERHLLDIPHEKSGNYGITILT